MTQATLNDPQILEAFKKKASSSGLYQFFDNFVYIRTNKPDILEGFDKIYWRFLRKETDLKNGFVQDLYILQEDSPQPRLIIIHQDGHQILENQTVTPNLYLFIFSYILPKVKSHYLVHSAVLSYKNKGTIITAHSTSGKTTLAVELIRKGIDFLSDELAPIHRKTHLIEPFPRSIGLRNLELHGLKPTPNSKFSQAPNAKGEIKWMIDPEDLRAGSVAKSCPCRQVIFLEPQYEENTQSETQQIIELTVTRLTSSLLMAVKRIPDVYEVEIVEDRIFPMLRLLTKKDAKILQEFEESVKVYGSAIVSVVYGKTQKPDFSLPPILKSMSKFEGTFELAKMLLNAHPEASLMDDFKQSPARLLSELADLTASFEFYKIMVGRLDLMTNLVEDLIKNENPS